MQEKKYLSFKEIAQSYPLTVPGLRSLIRQHASLKSLVRKIGKRGVIRKDLFDDWIERQGDKKGQPEELTAEFGCSHPINFNTSKGVKRMEPGKTYDENFNEIIQSEIE